jgi:hypothetical protein
MHGGDITAMDMHNKDAGENLTENAKEAPNLVREQVRGIDTHDTHSTIHSPETDVHDSHNISHAPETQWYAHSDHGEWKAPTLRELEARWYDRYTHIPENAAAYTQRFVELHSEEKSLPSDGKAADALRQKALGEFMQLEKLMLEKIGGEIKAKQHDEAEAEKNARYEEAQRKFIRAMAIMTLFTGMAIGPVTQQLANTAQQSMQAMR